MGILSDKTVRPAVPAAGDLKSPAAAESKSLDDSARPEAKPGTATAPDINSETIVGGGPQRAAETDRDKESPKHAANNAAGDSPSPIDTTANRGAPKSPSDTDKDVGSKTIAGGGPPEGSFELDLPKIDPDFYTDHKALSKGGMGRIITARDTRLKRTVALKELLSDDADTRARFAREVMLTARLQHPSIVRIYEAGRWPDGEPFYAMDLVKGRPLEALMDEAKTLEQRMALLPHVIAVADALGYAHAERVLHRDLKPGNVMVGSHGETVVIDWGLAKDISSYGDDEPSLPKRRRGQRPKPGETFFGDVMGTPMYMAPEQAYGEPLDERCDVYAIGAILYQLLAGDTPYGGNSTHEVLEAVLKGPPKPLAKVAPGVPSDLVAIVERAMEREQEDRYATAKELAEDLRRFQAGQLVGAHQYSFGELFGRWVRKHWRILAVSGLAVVALTALAIYSVQRIVGEREVARHERSVAVASRTQADRLLDLILVELKERLEPLGRLDMLDEVSEEVSAYYAKAPKGTREDQRRRMFAHDLRGDVLRAEGKMAEALAQYRISQEIGFELAKDPSDTFAPAELIAGSIKIGDVLVDRGETDAAIETFKATVERAAKLGDANWTARVHRATASEHLATLLAKNGEYERALREARTARDLRVRNATEHPDDADAADSVARSGLQIGDLIAERDVGAAITEYKSTLALIEPYAIKDPTNMELQRLIGAAHSRIANKLIHRFDYSGALAEARQALAISQRLAAADPTNMQRQRDLSIDHRTVGDTLRQLGDAAGALAEYRTSLAIRERIAALDPTNLHARRDVATGRQQLGDGLMLTDPKAALAEYRTAQTLMTELATHDETSLGRARDLAMAHLKVGDALDATDDLDGARTAYEAGLEISRKLYEQDKASLQFTRDLATFLENLGRIAIRSKDYGIGRASFAEAVALRMAALDASDAVSSHELARAREGLGDALDFLGDTVGSKREWEAVLSILEKLAAAAPDDKELADAIRGTRIKLGN